jgi:mycothiol synthase
MLLDETKLPALYMLWSASTEIGAGNAGLTPEYSLTTYKHSDAARIRELLESEWETIDDTGWQDYLDQILPDGLFIISHKASGQAIATAGACHNPNPGRHYFPFGGELGYLMVHPLHRGRELGKIVSTMVVKRFLSAGYSNIRVGVQGFRLPAIRTYLAVGFVPFIYDDQLRARWERIFDALGKELENWVEEFTQEFQD